MPRPMIGVIACLTYSATSMIMTFSNKLILDKRDGFAFDNPLALLLYQHLFTVAFVFALYKGKIIQLDRLDLDLFKRWIPMNLLFVLMLITGQFSLEKLSVPMVTIFKNLTTIMISIGDSVFYGQKMDTYVGTSLLIMLGGGVLAGLNDLQFNFYGYAWMLSNCSAQTAYVLYMRRALGSRKLQHPKFSPVYFNNLLGLPTLIPLLLWNGLGESIFQLVSLSKIQFLLVLLLNGLCGFAISFASFFAVRMTSPTTYSVVGSLNKIPLALLGAMLFTTEMNTLGIAGTSVSLTGGVLYSASKQKEVKEYLDRVLGVRKPKMEGPDIV